MSEQSVLAGVVFWDFGHHWSLPTGVQAPADVSPAEQSTIQGWVSYLYEHSSNAAQLLEQGTTGGKSIYIGGGLSDLTAIVYDPSYPSFSIINVSFSANLVMCDNHGYVVQEDPRLALIHEIQHQVAHTLDPVGYNGTGGNGPYPTEAEQNSSDYDYDGDTVRFERLVAADLGLPVRADYQSVFAPGDTRLTLLTVGRSYSDGAYISICRYGDWFASQPNIGPNDNIDISGRQDNLNLLSFGFSGDDVLKGHTANDYLYGGSGNDQLYGDSGNDKLVGDGGNDYVIGEAGADFIHGGSDLGTQASTRAQLKADGTDTADYSTLAASDPSHGIKISLTDVAPDSTWSARPNFGSASFVTDLGRDHATDTLISVENITGTSADDIVAITTLDPKRIAGSDGTAGVHQIDLGGQNKGDLVDMSGASGSYTVHLDGATPNISNGGTTVYVKGAEQLLTSNNGDQVFGGSAGEKIVGGTGSDTLHGGDGADYLFTGLTPEGGADWLYGDAGDDNIVVQGGVSAELSGGNGNDTFWIPLIPRTTYDPAIEILDPDAGDTLRWNGYAIKGGAAYHIDFENQGQLIHWAYLDSHGVIYKNYASDPSSLDIQFPDGQTVHVGNWHQGYLGITLTGGQLQQEYQDPAAHPIVASRSASGDMHTLYYDPNPDALYSNICNDGHWDNLDKLNGAAGALKRPGGMVAPVPPTSAGPASIGIHLDAGIMTDRLHETIWHDLPMHHMNLV